MHFLFLFLIFYIFFWEERQSPFDFYQFVSSLVGVGQYFLRRRWERRIVILVACGKIELAHGVAPAIGGDPLHFLGSIKVRL